MTFFFVSLKDLLFGLLPESYNQQVTEGIEHFEDLVLDCFLHRLDQKLYCDHAFIWKNGLLSDSESLRLTCQGELIIFLWFYIKNTQACLSQMSSVCIIGK